MKISVKVNVEYDYECEVADGLTGLECAMAADFLDPVYDNLYTLFHKKGLNFFADTNSIVDNETGEVLFLNDEVLG